MPFSLNYCEAISEVPEIFHKNLLQDVRFSNPVGLGALMFLRRAQLHASCHQMNNSTTTPADMKAVDKGFTKLQLESTSRPSIFLYQDKEKSVIQ